MLPIHDADAEDALIAALVIDSDSLYDVLDVANPGDCYKIQNRAVFESIMLLDERNEPVDVVTIQAELKGRSKGDVAIYLLELMARLPNACHAVKYANIVKDMATRRQLSQVANKINTLAHDMTLDAEAVLSESEANVFDVRSENVNGVEIPTDYMMNYLHHLDRMQNHNGDLVGISSGFIDIDRMLDGFQKPYQYIIAGRPGMGKSAFAGSLAMNMISKGLKVAFFALEMSTRQIIDRLIARETKIPLNTVKKPWLLNGKTEKIQAAAGKLSTMNLYIDDSPGLTPSQIRAKCMRLKAQHGLDLVIVDHLHLVKPDRSLSRQDQEITEITKSFMNLGKSLDIPILTLAQLSRKVEQRAIKKPMLSDLRESGGIEENAYSVLFLYRDEYYNDMSERPNIADVIIAKNRDGATGEVSLYFRNETASFENLKKEAVL